MEDNAKYIVYGVQGAVEIVLINGKEILYTFENQQDYKNFMLWYGGNEPIIFTLNNVKDLCKKIHLRREAILFIRE